jgi:hypothetical protein
MRDTPSSTSRWSEPIADEFRVLGGRPSRDAIFLFRGSLFFAIDRAIFELAFFTSLT